MPAPIHESETVSFGVSAPTTSTTVALALGDALAVVASQELHPTVAPVFAKNHPGGAIGQTFRGPRQIRDLAIPLHEIPICSKLGDDATSADILKWGYSSQSGWVLVDDAITSPRRIKRLDTDHMTMPISSIPDLMVERGEWISIHADTMISQAAEWLRGPLISPDYDEAACTEDSILAITDGMEIIGVLEAGQLLDQQE